MNKHSDKGANDDARFDLTKRAVSLPLFECNRRENRKRA